MQKTLLAATVVLAAISPKPSGAAPPTDKDLPDAAAMDTVRSRFGVLMDLANRHDMI
jgi:hypothetical protein